MSPERRHVDPAISMLPAGMQSQHTSYSVVAEMFGKNDLQQVKQCRRPVRFNCSNFSK